ncbi:MAG: tryptophan synthase subunit alpha [Anaerolineales bacterium]|nr:tryptophan synthase subunit alpha [Anaerolineales bacterium]
MGLNKIKDTFTATFADSRAALMPYFTLGYPTIQASVDIIEGIANSGADLIELGLPFSDPLADGPVIQASTQIALDQGINIRKCLELVAQIRARGVQQPLLLMGYINPLLAYGLERFVEEAARSGADGFIVPDLPYDEAEQLEKICARHELALVAMLAPTSTEERIIGACRHTSGFLYLVSLTGVTGERNSLPPDLTGFVNRVRKHTSLPLAVGFGIATPEQAAAVGQVADGVIIGSAVVRAGKSGKVNEVTGLIRGLKEALEK